MKCPRCTHHNPPGVKFCSECGLRMGTLCPDCNTMNLTELKQKSVAELLEQAREENQSFVEEQQSRIEIANTAVAATDVPHHVRTIKHCALAFAHTRTVGVTQFLLDIWHHAMSLVA